MGETAAAPRWAIIGTGRSGTGYCAAVMRQHGQTVGHERWFTTLEHRILPGLDGDVSWLALPWIERGIWSGPVVHVVRHPVATVRSKAAAMDPNKNSAFYEFMCDHCPPIRGLPAVEAAVEWWARWNTRCARVADVTLRLEDLATPQACARLSDVLGLNVSPAVVAAIPATTNAHRGRVDAEPGRIWELLDGRADAFGYAPENRSTL